MNTPNEQGLIQEIDEDLARKRMEALWKKYAPTLISAALVIILATASMSWWRNHKLETEQTATQALMAITQKVYEKKDEQKAALAAFAKENAGKSQASFALFESASLALEQGKKEEAVALYDGIAASKDVDALYRQLADLFSVQTQLDTGDVKTLEARLAPLMDANGAWRFSAKELAAFLALRAGDKDKAKALFSELKGGQDVPAHMAARATDILQWLGQGEKK